MSLAPDLTRRPRTKRPFTEDDMARMRDLYYDRAIPLTHVAAAFGIPVSTLLRWIAEMDWPRRSAQVTPIDARRDLYAQVQADPPRRRRNGPAPDKSDLARDVAFAARAELDALAAERGRIGFEDRRRRAAVIDQLSRAVARMERVEAKRFSVYEGLEKSVEALARSMKPPKDAARKRPERQYRLYGAGGKPEGGW